MQQHAIVLEPDLRGAIHRVLQIVLQDLARPAEFVHAAGITALHGGSA